MKDEFMHLGQVLLKKCNGRLYVRKTRFSNYMIKPLARYVYERVYGELPKNLEIHHKDLNPHNDSLDNLVAVDKERHVDIHAKISLKRLKEFLLRQLQMQT